MPHVLVAGKLHPAGLEVLRKEPGISFDYVEEISESSYQPHLPKAEALVIRTQALTGASIARAPALRMVSRHGVGFDAVDVAALSARGIPLAIVGDVNSSAVAERAMLLILAASHRLIEADRATRVGDWAWRNGLLTHEVAGKRLLILGLGRIGKRLTTLAQAFGMVTAAHDPFLPASAWPDTVARETDLTAALGTADILSLHLPPGDRPVLGAAEIARLKPGAIVINTARGGLIDEPALARALRQGHLSAAGIDVFGEEPPAPDNPLFGLPQAVLTPHNAALTAECARRMALASVRNVLDFFAGRLDPRLVVNREALR
jgi:D-3-phosphoglycerate dehydrogenase